MLIYHGSKKIIKKPQLGLGKVHNDYGQGFYCTKDLELAKEWACDYMLDGYANAYEVNTKNLKIFDLTEEKYSVLHWLTILIQNRTFNNNNSMERLAKEFLINHYSIDINKYDIIKGYRADDSYFRFAEDFLNNSISLEKLEEAMKLGKLGEQIVLKSEKAFDSIRFVEGKTEYADSSIYYAKRKKRDENARKKYKVIKQDLLSGCFIRDIIKEEVLKKGKNYEQ